jgi:N-acyl-L-homoserine lactone synthetase
MKNINAETYMESVIRQALAFNRKVNWPYNEKQMSPVRNRMELLEIFRLRSKIYRGLNYQNEFPDPVEGYNFDGYDTHAAIFYTHYNGKITGTCRIIFDTEGRLPIDENYSLDHLRQKHGRIAELSRFIIDNDVTGLSPEFKLLIKGMYGIVEHNDIDLAVSVIAKEHYKFYNKVGGFQKEALLPTYGHLKRPYMITTWDTSKISSFFKRAFLSERQPSDAAA